MSVLILMNRQNIHAAADYIVSVLFAICRLSYSYHIAKLNKPMHWLGQFCPLGMTMNCSFSNILKRFLFLILAVTSHNHESQSKEILCDFSDLECTGEAWVKISDGCYCFSKKPGSWEESKEYCSNRSSYPVEIGSQEEQLSIAGASFMYVSTKNVSHKQFPRLR